MVGIKNIIKLLKLLEKSNDADLSYEGVKKELGMSVHEFSAIEQYLLENGFIKIITSDTEYKGKKERITITSTGIDFLRKETNFWSEMVLEWKKWVVFTLGVTIITTIIASYLIPSFMAYAFPEVPCRIDVNLLNDEFAINKSMEFYLPYSVTNLKNQKILLNDVKAFCYWTEPTPTQENQTGQNSQITPEPKIPDVPVDYPPELSNIPELGSKSLRNVCRSPDLNGRFNIRIIATTNTGSCSKILSMIVKD